MFELGSPFFCSFISRINGQSELRFICRSPYVTKKIYKTNDKGPALARMSVYYIDHNIYIVKNMYIMGAYGLGIVRPKMSNIPRSASLFLRRAWVLVVSNINKVV